MENKRDLTIIPLDKPDKCDVCGHDALFKSVAHDKPCCSAICHEIMWIVWERKNRKGE